MTTSTPTEARYPARRGPDNLFLPVALSSCASSINTNSSLASLDSCMANWANRLKIATVMDVWAEGRGVILFICHPFKQDMQC